MIEAGVGFVGGHITPSARLKQTVENYIHQHGKQLLIDIYIGTTGDDIAILKSHSRA